MDKNVNIKFNASDGGSFEKFAQRYRDLLKNMGGGMNYVQSQRYTFSEMDKELKFLQEKLQKEKQIFEEKRRQMEQLSRASSNAAAKYKSGNITKDQYDSIEADIAKREKELLKGTGRRSWDSYVKNTKRNIANSENLFDRKNNFMDETNNLLRQILNQDRETGQNIVRDINKNPHSSESEKLAAELAQQQFEYEKRHNKQQPNFLQSMFAYENITSLLGGLRQYSKSKTGFDMIGTTGSNIGNIVGGLLGGVIGSFIGPEGTVGGGLLGANLGSKIGEMIGGGLSDMEQEVLMSIQQYEKSLNLYRARTGATLTGVNSVKDFGMDPNDIVKLTTEAATRAGSRINAQQNGYSAAILNKGFGIDENTSMQLLQAMRQLKPNDQNLMNIVGGIWDRGQSIFHGDRTFLNEFIQRNFVPLQQQLLKNQSNVSSGTVLEILNRFNAVGGQFSALNPNSMGLIGQINGSLVNPGSDNVKALAFNALRQLHPTMGIFDILKEQQKGLNSPGYLQAMMSQVDRIGGTMDQKRLNLAGMLGMEDNLDAVDQLFRNRGQIMSGKFNASNLIGSKTNTSSVHGLAVENTTELEKRLANTQEAQLQGIEAATKAIAENLGVALHEVLDGTSFVVQNGKVYMQTNVVPKPQVDYNHSSYDQNGKYTVRSYDKF